MKKVKYNELLAAFYRLVRGFIAAGAAQAVLVRPDWGNLEEAVKALSVAFVAGLISAIFKYLRDKKVIPERLPL